MQQITFIAAMKRVVAMFKLATDPANLPTLDVPPYQGWAGMLEKRVREAYEYADWPSLIITEQRTADSTGLISFAQPGELRIGKVLGVFTNNPITETQTQPKPFLRTTDGVQVYQGENTEFYVQYRRAAPRFTTTMYVPESNQYQPGDVVCWPAGSDEQLYGNCYEARLNASNEFYWDEQIIPLEMSGWVVEATFCDALMMDGQRERAAEHMASVARPELYRAAKAATSQQNVTPRAKVKIP